MGYVIAGLVIGAVVGLAVARGEPSPGEYASRLIGFCLFLGIATIIGIVQDLQQQQSEACERARQTVLPGDPSRSIAEDKCSGIRNFAQGAGGFAAACIILYAVTPRSRGEAREKP